MSPHRRGLLVHAIGHHELAAADTAVTPQSLADEGFVHLSRPDQIAWVANQRFVGRTDLVLLVIDQDRLPQQVVWEDCYESGQEFPHLYSPLPLAAVVDRFVYTPDSTGTFHPPAHHLFG